MKEPLTTSASGSSQDIFIIISFCSWIILIVTSWMPILSFGKSDNKIIAYFWLFIDNKDSDDEELDYTFMSPKPLIKFEVFMLIYILILILTTIGFLSYIYNLYQRNDSLINGMFGKISKFHFIPLLCISALFIIGESYAKNEYNEAKYVFSLIFTLFSIISLIFISFRTRIQSPIYLPLTINKGSYSGFLALLIYNLGSVFTNYGLYKKFNSDKMDVEEILNWFKRCYMAFSILVGILNNIIAIFLKDFMISFFNLLIYIGLTVRYFNLDEDTRKENLYKNEAIGVIDIIMIVITFGNIVFYFIRTKGAIIPNEEYYA